VRSAGLTIIFLLAAVAAQARDLPGWQSLEYQQKALWFTAQSVITLEASNQDPATWLLVTNSAIARNRELVQIELDASSGRTIKRRRFSEGKEKRLKQYDYQATKVMRERRSQPNKLDSNADSWPVTGRQQLPIPAPAADSIVVNAYTLLLLAADALAAESGSVQHYVHTDFNFYQVTSTVAAREQIQVDFVSEPGTIPMKGLRWATAVSIRAQADGGNSDKPDFDFFGLEGEVTILYDDETGIPLLLRGLAPRLGATSLKLTAVTMRNDL
jgi:hypothetical protein